MEKLAVQAVPPNPGLDVVQRALAPALGADAVAINHYRVPPGGGFPSGLHAHADQEEIFVVLDGRATFETYDPDSGEGGEVAVAAGEVVRFAPGEFQSGWNAGGDDLVALALGAPRDSEDVRLPIGCPDCERADLRLETAGGLTVVCPDCGAERVPGDCPDCGGVLRMTLGASDEPVAACGDCGARFENPPLADPSAEE